MFSERYGLLAAGLGALAMWGGACQNTEPRLDTKPATVLVSAAISLADVFGAVADVYERKTGTRVLLNLAGSNLLVNQLIAGAPIDVIISADVRQMDRAEAAGLIRAGGRMNLLSNQLVVVVPVDRVGTVTTVDDLASPEVGRIALGDPDAVPAGVYARDYLESIGLWSVLRGKVVPTRNVRAALAAVEAGTVAAGFVYRTDAAMATNVVRAFEVPIDTGPFIVYPAAVVSAAPNATEASRLFEFLRGSEARRLFEGAGFIALQPAVSEASGLFTTSSK